MVRQRVVLGEKKQAWGARVDEAAPPAECDEAAVHRQRDLGRAAAAVRGRAGGSRRPTDCDEKQLLRVQRPGLGEASRDRVVPLELDRAV